MKILNGKGRPRGFTLIEMVVAISLVSILGLFIFKMMRNFVDGLGGVQRSIPLQRDLQIAKYVIEKDLLSARAIPLETPSPIAVLRKRRQRCQRLCLLPRGDGRASRTRRRFQTLNFLTE
ncbi:MAG: prepilin-type N-terminal cleavage/methylation domain-containing protein [Elusimicrobia bacterium]|nr:prepilin-type N-terminal cleavage/methylation domain-containing protein [Elusimicrobiota bacterium]